MHGVMGNGRTNTKYQISGGIWGKAMEEIDPSILSGHHDVKLYRVKKTR